MCRFTSLGNAADLDETQILRWLAEDDQTQVIGLFAEALSRGRDFVSTVRSISAKRPVVVLNVTGELEIVVGGLRDPHFGPAVMIGLGGVAAEVFNDTVTVLAPPEPGEVESAVKALGSAPLLLGHRGTKPIDLKALEATIHTVADALNEHDDIIDIDYNPVLISAGKPTVVDALVVVCTARSETPCYPARQR